MKHSAAYYKLGVHQQCIAYADERIQNSKLAMDAAQASANEEGKSSAGDKYETGRAMMQIERDKAAVQLNEALKLKAALESIKIEEPLDRVSVGSLVLTDVVNFYVSISAGAIIIDDATIIAVSPQAPIANILLGLKKHDVFIFNKKQCTIVEIA